MEKVNYVNGVALKRIAKKTLKVVRNTMIGVVSLAIISAVGLGGYSAYMHHVLNKIELDQEKVKDIVDCYNGEKITFVGLNDSQLVNLNVCFWEPNVIEYIEEAFKKEGANVQFIDAASLRFNKTNHIDKILDSNLSYEEIKTLNLLGAQEAFSRVSSDFNLPIDIGFLGSLFVDSIEEKDSSIYISTEIQNSNHPIILYTSGANDLMRALNNNPLSIKKYAKDGSINDSYLYSVYKAKQHSTLDHIMNNIENNFENIYSINPTSQIYALSIYIPNNMTGEDMQPFAQIINNYNQRLEQLCNKWGAYYISTASLASIYMETDNFHINEKGHKNLANLLINQIANTLTPNDIENFNDFKKTEIKNKGLSEFSNRLNEDIKLVPQENYPEINYSYLKSVCESIQKEISEERDLANNANEKVKRLHKK